MSPGLRRLLWLLVRIAVTAAGVAYVFDQLEGATLLPTVRTADPVWLVGSVVALVASTVFGGLRWWVLLREEGVALGPARTLRIAMEGRAVGLLLPSSLGEDAYRAIGLWQGQSDRTHALGNIIFDRLLGLLGLGALAMFAAWASPDSLGPARPVVQWVGPALVLGCGVVVLSATSLRARISTVPRLSAVAGYLDRVRAHLGNGPLLLKMSLLVFLQHGVAVVCASAIAMAYGVDLGLAFFAAVMPPLWVLSLLPTLGGLGPREAGLASLCGLAGVAPVPASAVALTYGAVSVVASMVGAVTLPLPRDRSSRRDR